MVDGAVCVVHIFQVELDTFHELVPVLFALRQRGRGAQLRLVENIVHLPDLERRQNQVLLVEHLNAELVFRFELVLLLAVIAHVPDQILRDVDNLFVLFLAVLVDQMLDLDVLEVAENLCAIDEVLVALICLVLPDFPHRVDVVLEKCDIFLVLEVDPLRLNTDRLFDQTVEHHRVLHQLAAEVHAALIKHHQVLFHVENVLGSLVAHASGGRWGIRPDELKAVIQKVKHKLKKYKLYLDDHLL